MIRIRVPNYLDGMRSEGVETGPRADIERVIFKRCGDPLKCFHQAFSVASLLGEAPPSHILHETMDSEFLLVWISPHQRIGCEIGESIFEVLGHQLLGRNLKQEVWHRLGR